jgi:16S rRNA (guanine527-N7)-methyltransferase
VANAYEGLVTGASELLDIDLTQQQIKSFAWYSHEMLDWNRRFNLTAITDPAEIEIKHFLDSLSCVLGMGLSPQGRVVDVGTGAGFPGLPLKIVYPHLELTLIESIGKKAEFCRHVIAGLALSGVTMLQARVEDAARMNEHRAMYDWALARAVAPMEVLAEYLLPLLRVGGKALAQKGETGLAEAHGAENAIRLLGGKLAQLIPVDLPKVAESRYLVLVEKVAQTPAKFPRRAGIPAKRPLSG